MVTSFFMFRECLKTFIKNKQGTDEEPYSSVLYLLIRNGAHKYKLFLYHNLLIYLKPCPSYIS